MPGASQATQVETWRLGDSWAPEGEEEQAAALIFKELGFFEPVPELVPAANVVRRSCTESQLFMALSTR